MKTRHLIGCLVALAPVIALAQAGAPPPVGNASESLRPGASSTPDGLAPDNLTTDSVSPDAPMDGVDNTTDPAAGTTVAPTPTPDPMAPAKSADPMTPKPKR